MRDQRRAHAERFRPPSAPMLEFHDPFSNASFFFIVQHAGGSEEQSMADRQLWNDICDVTEFSLAVFKQGQGLTRAQHVFLPFTFYGTEVQI